MIETPAGSARFYGYGFSGTPSVMFDGVTSSVGGAASGSMYSTYEPLVQARLGVAAPLTIDAAYTIIGATGTVGADLDVTDAVPAGTYDVRLVVVEQLGAPTEPNLYRAELASEPFTLSTPGEHLHVQRSFPVDPGWDPDHLRVVVFVQREGSPQTVLQAAIAAARYAATLTVDVTPDGLDAPWALTGPSGLVVTGVDDKMLYLFEAGEYELVWEEIPGWTLPSPSAQPLTLAQDDAVVVSGQYTDGPFAAHTEGDLGLAGAAARGVAMVDADEDGRLDVYVSREGEPNTLLINGGGFVFTAGGPAVLADDGADRSAVWADIDGDGHRDVYLSRNGEANRLLRSDGAGGYTDATFDAVGDAGPGASATAVDYDHDGILDLYVVNEGAANVLLKGVCDIGGLWYMQSQGGIVADAGLGSSAAWTDLDGDGDQDLYLCNRFAANRLLRNDGFYGWSDLGGNGAPSDVGNGMGCAWGDYDNDGWLDLYFTNDGGVDKLVRNGHGSWDLIGGGALGDQGHGRGVAWGDLDNDGDLDLYLARHGDKDLILRNDGGAFTAISTGIVALNGPAEGVALGDVDGDGALDVYVANGGGTSVLLRNTMAAGNHWLQLDLTADAPNTSAIGARVWLTANGSRQLREVAGGSGYLSQNAPVVAFGLGAAAVADTVRIRWPDGEQQVLTDVAADRRLAIVQGGPTAAPIARAPATLSLHLPEPNPFNPATTLSYDLPRSGRVSLRVFDLSGRVVRVLRADVVEPAGRHRVRWDGRDDAGRAAPAGVYLARLASGGAQSVQRLLLVK